MTGAEAWIRMVTKEMDHGIGQKEWRLKPFIVIRLYLIALSAITRQK